MSYDYNWNSNHPGHVVYLVDLSGSMGTSLEGVRLIDKVTDALTALFNQLKGPILWGDHVLEYLSVTVLGYNDDVITLFDKKTAEEFVEFVESSRNRGFLFDTQKGGIAEPNWRTFMADAFDAAAVDIKNWIAEQERKGIRRIPAPVVINITDGAPYEGPGVDAIGKALAAANRVKNICTPDGNTLVFNIHVTLDKNASRLVLPSEEPRDEYTRFLFHTSSIVPPKLVDGARYCWEGVQVTNKSRAMISNENDPDSLLRFITWGTSTGGAAQVDQISMYEGIEKPKPR